MRACEFITEDKEGKLDPDQEAASPGTVVYPDLDNSNEAYRSYRYAIALAKSPDEIDMDQRAAMGSYLTSVVYTDADLEILKKADKFMGVKRKYIAKSGSSETTDVNKSSPVALRRKNRYGV